VIGLLLACSRGASEPQADAVGGHSGDADAGSLRLGQGDLGFEPLADGDVAWLHPGPQGLQHVWVTLQRDGAPGFGLVELALDVDGVVVSSPFEVSVPWTDDGAGGVQAIGLTLVVPDPASALGLDAVLRARALEEADQVEVVVEWAATR
jgi:hypothetical protein